MPVNKQSKYSNMYPGYVTQNFIRGWPCPHKCTYCYMTKMMERFKKKPQKIRFVDTELNTDLGKGEKMFVGSSIDMFAETIPKLWIELVLQHCRRYDNEYLFQTKNPKRFFEFINPNKFPAKTLFGITIESNRDFQLSKAPSPKMRKESFKRLRFDKMVSIEPLMDFNLDIMVSWIKEINPKYASIGADSQGCKLPEPNPEKVQKLIEELKQFTEVKIKSNLKRIMEKGLNNEKREKNIQSSFQK